MTAGLAFHFSTLMSKLQKDPDVCKGRFHRFISYGVDTDEPSPISHSFLHCVNVMALQRALDSGVALAPIRLRRSRPHYVALSTTQSNRVKHKPLTLLLDANPGMRGWEIIRKIHRDKINHSPYSLRFSLLSFFFKYTFSKVLHIRKSAGSKQPPPLPLPNHLNTGC